MGEAKQAKASYRFSVAQPIIKKQIMPSKIYRVNNNIIKIAYRDIIHTDADVERYIIRTHIRYITKISTPTQNKLSAWMFIIVDSSNDGYQIVHSDEQDCNDDFRKLIDIIG